MCRSVDQPVLVSEAFANVDGMRGRLVSVGRYALRGVAQPQELFTLDPAQADLQVAKRPAAAEPGAITIAADEIVRAPGLPSAVEIGSPARTSGSVAARPVNQRAG